MLKIKTEKQEAYMEHAMSKINLMGYKSPEVKEVEVVKETNNEKDTWTIKQWDEYFKSRK
tara:strand:+ start:794 stop:973 length:180 start_codon:yes stop_codon:yes gene_type:complete